MTKKFRDLVKETMSQDAQDRAAAKTEEMLAAMDVEPSAEGDPPTVNCPACGHAAVCSPCEQLRVTLAAAEARASQLERERDVYAAECDRLVEKVQALVRPSSRS